LIRDNVHRHAYIKNATHDKKHCPLLEAVVIIFYNGEYLGKPKIVDTSFA